MTSVGHIAYLPPCSVICDPRFARAANDTARTQISNMPSKSHFIPLLHDLGHYGYKAYCVTNTEPCCRAISKHYVIGAPRTYRGALEFKVALYNLFSTFSLLVINLVPRVSPPPPPPPPWSRRERIIIIILQLLYNLPGPAICFCGKMLRFLSRLLVF